MGNFTSRSRRNHRSRYAPRPLTVRLLFLSLKIYSILVLTHFVVFHSLFFPLVQSSDAMMPSIAPNEGVIVSRLSYTFKPLEELFSFSWQRPGRGDLVVFATPYQESPGVSENILRLFLEVFFFGHRPQFLRSESLFGQQGYQIRRIVGVPGDTLEFRLGEWYISNQVIGSFTSELLLSEREYRPRLPEVRNGLISPFGDSTYPFSLGEDEYFVAADNRTGALDSRHYGVISFRDIQGRAIVRYIPLSRYGIL